MPEESYDEAWADEKFPDRGEPPSDEVIVDPDAKESPNVAHPK
jgi:hypothetical protein